MSTRIALAVRLGARSAASLGLASLFALVAVAPVAAAWSSVAYPTQSLGDRGTDVVAIQMLLRARGQSLAITGTFDGPTVVAVKGVETASALPADGIVDSRLWPLLTPRLEPGATGEPVGALQRELNEKRGAKLTAGGVFDGATRSALLAFQKHAGIGQTGIAGPVTWRALLWHFELPRFIALDMLCDYSVGNGAANWGTAAAIAQLEAAGRAIRTAGMGRIAVGDIGFEHGGPLPGHLTHARGLDVDVRPIKVSRNQCLGGTNWRLSTYDRSATRALIRAIRAAAPGHVKLIYFNDPVLIKEGLTTSFSGHDDHIHVRYCEQTHPDKAYAC